ncbi:glucose dehydrogenase [FAD, quinone]-like [Culex pipiens pallens]|uniref:glucose dehydrogenase [FAD, quinone]-like n=1 Tax=Culex pipiens pallens TaxID=42434 RepID=UPI001953D804|nr:glucose dehydrogenase [FAD, quinone]-like [Culex pipiens pallens]
MAVSVKFSILVATFAMLCVVGSGNAFFFLLKSLAHIDRYDTGDNFVQPTYGGSGSTSNTQSKEIPEYDFVIVGAGPAGCVLANQLSENARWKVLLLEAGPVENEFNNIPILTGFLQNSDYNWADVAEYQNSSCWGMVDQRCSVPHGKGLGGSTLINYMMYQRGNRADYDRWAAMGNPGWSYDDVFPYFLKSERASLRGLENSTYHGYDGMLHVEFPPFRTNLARTFVKGAREVGHKKVDQNGKTQLGVSYVQTTTLNGMRQSAYRAFVEPVLANRPNLHVKAYSRVTKVLINHNTKQAYGVTYSKHFRNYDVHARKEVILTAGSINSPHLLMLSGVGPEEHLRNIKVPAVANLPVGQSIADGVLYNGLTFVLNETGQALLSDSRFQFRSLADYFQGQGPLTVPGGVEAVSFLQTSRTQEMGVPDIALIFSTGSLVSDGGLGIRSGKRIKTSIYNKVYRPLETLHNDQWTATVMLLHPKSRGYMKLRNANPFNNPKIYTNQLLEEDDVETLLEGIKEAVRISKSPSMQRYDARVLGTPLPNCQQFALTDDEYWRCAIRTLSSTAYQQLGTCRMGPQEDSTAVVSPELLVHGIQGLRVADTSVVPTTISGQTAAVAYMIGEKAADLVKQSWSSM